MNIVVVGCPAFSFIFYISQRNFPHKECDMFLWYLESVVAVFWQMRSRIRLIVQTCYESRCLTTYRWIHCLTSVVLLTTITIALVLKLLSCSDISSGYIINIYRGRHVCVHSTDVHVNRILWSHQTTWLCQTLYYPTNAHKQEIVSTKLTGPQYTYPV